MSHTMNAFFSSKLSMITIEFNLARSKVAQLNNEILITKTGIHRRLWCHRKRIWRIDYLEWHFTVSQTQRTSTSNKWKKVRQCIIQSSFDVQVYTAYVFSLPLKAEAQNCYHLSFCFMVFQLYLKENLAKAENIAIEITGTFELGEEGI